MRRNKTIQTILIFAIIVLVFIIHGSVAAQNQKGQYFKETGHWVRGDFYDKYIRVEHPEIIYGLPITDAFLDQDKGRTIQYFEFAQFELHPEAFGDDRVQLTPIGDFAYEAGERVPFTPNPTACQYFREENHWVCYEFLEFFNEFGGVEQFGYPISDFEFHNDYITQYFEYARFEWHPENARGEQVRLGSLGREYFSIRNESISHLQAQPSGQIVEPITIESLNAFVFVGTPVTHRGGEQTYYIIVQDQDRNPVSGAQVAMNITLPNGVIEKFNLAPTDENGLSESPPLTITSDEVGTARVHVIIQKQGLETTSYTSYFIWW